MSELRDLYQEVILDHGKRPRNFEAMPDHDRSANGHNPLCGDKITVYVKLNGDRVEKVSFRGTGCAISTASASMMTDAMVGMTFDEVEALFQAFHRLLTEETDDETPDPALKKLVVFSGVRQFPVRIKCATLAWHTVRAALEKRETATTTE